MTLLAHDIDAHEMIPSHLLGEVFGEPGKMLGILFDESEKQFHDPTATNMTQKVDDTMVVDPGNIWEVKGPGSPSAIDLTRRVEVLDVMGVEKQLVFPTNAIAAMIVGGMETIAFEQRFGVKEADVFGSIPRPQFAKNFVDAYNDWVIDNAHVADGRIVMVGIVPTSDNVQDMVDTAQRLVDGGVKAVWMQADTPPGGVSPAHSMLDPLWKLYADNNVAVTLHIGTEFFFLDPRWCFAETFTDLFQSPEIPNTNIQLFSTVHMAVENYLSALVLGGVFERHPQLRVGLLEVGGYWVGPAAERMDMYIGVFPGAAAAKLPLKPSEYVARNVRVSPFNFEPVDKYFEQYPHLADVFAFSTDYPHVEGTKNSKANMAAKVDRLGEEISTKFFRTNAEWLLP